MIPTLGKYFAVLLVAIATGCDTFTTEKQTKKEEGKSKKDGIVTTKYPDGKTRSVIPMKNGKQNGRAKEYYKNGKLSLEIDYVNGVKHGVVRRYYLNGQLHHETPYDNGLAHGIEKRYRENGMLSAEVPFNKGNPCMGLKEYLTDGSPRKKYPTIVVTPVNTLLKNGKYTLQVSMSDNSKNVEYYRGDLLEGNCLSNFIGNIFPGKKPGTGEFTYTLPSGAFIMEEVNIIAKVKTLQGNSYITQRKYNVAIENPY